MMTVSTWAVGQSLTRVQVRQPLKYKYSPSFKGRKKYDQLVVSRCKGQRHALPNHHVKRQRRRTHASLPLTARECSIMLFVQLFSSCLQGGGKVQLSSLKSNFVEPGLWDFGSCLLCVCQVLKVDVLVIHILHIMCTYSVYLYHTYIILYSFMFVHQ